MRMDLPLAIVATAYHRHSLSEKRVGHAEPPEREEFRPRVTLPAISLTPGNSLLPEHFFVLELTVI